MKRFSALLVAMALALGLTGCSNSSIAQNTTINLAILGGFNSINADNVTTLDAAQSNLEIANLVRPSFYYIDKAGALVANEKFGTATLVSKNPFKVEYRLTGEAKWSDGSQLDASDLMLSWLAASNPLDAGFDSVRKASGLDAAPTPPRVSADKLAITVTFTHPVTDWQTGLTIDLAAHLVADKANADILDAAKNADLQKQQSIAKAYTELASVTASTANNESLRVSAGPYAISAIDFDKSVTLIANPGFTWGPLPKVEKVIVRFYTDATAMLAAMQAGEVDVAAPEESGIATIKDLTALAKSADAKISLQNSNLVESILLNRGELSVFNELQYSQHPEYASKLRSAFLNLVPRAKILASASEDVETQEAKSFVFAADSQYYQPTVQANGSDEYLIQDAEKAAELVKSTNLRAPILVRVLFDSDSTRAKREFTLISEYAKTAGFELVDVSSQDPRALLKTGEFDVYIIETDLAGEIGGEANQFTSDSSVKFGNPAIDALLVKLSTKAEAIDQIAILKQIDAELFKADFGLPLYRLPAMIAVSKRVQSLTAAPFGRSVTWGYWTWSVPANK